MTTSADARRFVWLLRAYIWPRWPALLLLLLTSVLATAIAAGFPVIMAPILDLALGRPITGHAGKIVPLTGVTLDNLGAAAFSWLGVESVGSPLRAIGLLAVAYVGLGLLKGLADFGNYLVALWIRVKAVTDMQADLFRHLLTLSLSFFTRQRTGDLLSRFNSDTRAATAGLETIAGTLFSAPILILIYVYLLATASPTLVGAALGAGVFHYVVTRGVRAPIRRLASDEFSLFADVAVRIQEVLLSIRTVKSFAAEAFERGRLGTLLRRGIRINMKLGVYKHGEEPARHLVNYVVEAALIFLAARELLAGRLTASTFFLFLYVGRAAMAQITLLAGAYTAMQSVLAASGRVAELFDERPALPDGRETIESFRDRIVLHDVSFDYGDEPVLRGVNLEICRGEIVALVGPSGVGKSTLADLILRLYDPVEGRITIDGRDVRRLRQDSYRRLFGVVPQEAILFNTTIRENIAYGRPSAAEADIVAAARVANAHDFVVELPDGYDTMVGDRGVRLSGGQRQRIAIARAILGHPPILVLDEATSSLDSESERLVREAIDRIVRDTTCIVIAHRLSTVLHADRIVVLNRGVVEAVGRHAELLATSETYAHLYRLQFAETDPVPGGAR